jgi:hypothetical protein
MKTKKIPDTNDEYISSFHAASMKKSNKLRAVFKKLLSVIVLL